MYSYSIVDAHAHIFPEKIARKATENIGRFYDIPMCHLGSAEELLRRGSAIGVKRYLVCSTATRPDQVEHINTFIHEQCQLHPEFFGFATMHPGYANFEAELDRAVALGLHGVKLHPDFQAFNIDAPEALPMYRAIADRGLPILFHTGDDRTTYSAPHRLRNIADRFPDLVCIGAHFGGYHAWAEAVDSLKPCKNVYFDTSSSLPFLSRGQAETMLRDFGVERFLWGSDFPMWDHAEELECFLSLRLTEDERERIFHGTFEALFGETV